MEGLGLPIAVCQWLTTHPNLAETSLFMCTVQVNITCQPEVCHVVIFWVFLRWAVLLAHHSSHHGIATWNWPKKRLQNHPPLSRPCLPDCDGTIHLQASSMQAYSTFFYSTLLSTEYTWSDCRNFYFPPCLWTFAPAEALLWRRLGHCLLWHQPRLGEWWGDYNCKLSASP